MNIYSITTTIDSQSINLLSIVDPQDTKGIPLNDKCIIGHLKDTNLPATPDNIIWNKKFLDHFHKTIVFFSQFSDQVITLAEKEKEGFVFITDKRNEGQSELKPEDIIGSFAVLHGRIVSESNASNSG